MKLEILQKEMVAAMKARNKERKEKNLIQTKQPSRCCRRGQVMKYLCLQLLVPR